MGAFEVRVTVPQGADVVASLLWRFNAEFQTWSPSVDELATRFTGHWRSTRSSWSWR